MRLTYVELENIKSYAQPQRVELTAGLNAVCGLNGSGKTTIVEAIGYALFDYLPYSQQAFRREAEQSGTIRVGVVARDEREYEIVRRIGGANLYYVGDAETGTRLADRREEVQRWVCQELLDVDPGTDLKALFKNAVGVPQGAMTADFQLAASARKAIFDPLLRVEEYRAAWEYLRQVESYLRDRTGTLDAEIARLAADTERIPETEERLASLHEQQEDCERRLAGLEAELARLETRREELDLVWRRLEEVRQSRLRAEYDTTRYADQLEAHREALAKAEDAARVVEESREAHALVTAARAALGSLEASRRERDELERQRAKAQNERHGHFGRIQELDAARRRALDAAAEAEQLASPVAEQEALQAEIAGKEADIAGRDRIAFQSAKLQAEAGRVEERLAAREAEIAGAHEAREATQGLSAARQELGEIQARLAAVAATREQARSLYQRGVALRERHDRLEREVDRAGELRRRVDTLEISAGNLDRLLVTESELREQRTRAAARIEYQELARAELEKRQCPLLELACPVVTATPAVLDSFGARMQALLQESTELQARLESIAGDITTARAATAELQQVQVELAGLTRSEAELAPAAEELSACREEYAALEKQLKGEPGLQQRRRELEELVTRLEQAEQRAAQLSLLEVRQREDFEALALQKAELVELGAQLKTMEAAAATLAELRERLNRLDDPRSRRHGLLARAQELAGIEATIEAAQKAMAEADGRSRALTGQLAPFESLDLEIAEHRRVEAEHQAGYERFLNNREIAAGLPQRKTEVHTATTVLAEAESRLAALKSQEVQTSGEYDADAHENVKQECSAANAALGVERDRLGRCARDLEEVDRELARLRRQEEKWRERVGVRVELTRVAEEMRFIRETINAAGPAVTETLLRNISQGANEIHADIMDDHASELRWERDYEVMVQRGSESRSFSQLSGGEQMSAALAVRLALLKEMSEADFAFFDEPTQNMDAERRTNLADQIRQVRGFEQLIVISHDDTFEHHTDNLIRVEKRHEETAVGAG